MRTTMLAVLMLTITTGAYAQGERELEFGGGLHLWNLQQHYDFSDFPTGPTVDLTWVRWGERWGGAFGVSGVLNRVDVQRGQLHRGAAPAGLWACHRAVSVSAGQ